MVSKRIDSNVLLLIFKWEAELEQDELCLRCFGGDSEFVITLNNINNIIRWVIINNTSFN